MKANSMRTPSVGDLYPLPKLLHLSLHLRYSPYRGFLLGCLAFLKLLLSILCLETSSTHAGVEYALAASFSLSFRKSTFLSAIPDWNERYHTNGVYVQPPYPPPPSRERVSPQKEGSRTSHLLFYDEDESTILPPTLSSSSFPLASYRPSSLFSSSRSLSSPSSPSSPRTATTSSPDIFSLRDCSGVTQKVRYSFPCFLTGSLLFIPEKEESTSPSSRRTGAWRDREPPSLQALPSSTSLHGSIQRIGRRRDLRSRTPIIPSVIYRGGGGTSSDVETGDNRCTLMMSESMTPVDPCRLLWSSDERTPSKIRGRGWSHPGLGSHTGRAGEVSSSTTSHLSSLSDFTSSCCCSSSPTTAPTSHSSSSLSSSTSALPDASSPLPLSLSSSSSLPPSSSSPPPSSLECPSSPNLSSSSSSPPSSPSLPSHPSSSSTTPLSSSSSFVSSPPSSFFFPSPFFANLPLPPYLSAALHHQGVTTPTGIQAASILLASTGQDVLLHAETGGGKTFSFLLPILHWHHHSQQKRESSSSSSSSKKRERTSESAEEPLERNISQKHYRLIFGEEKRSPSFSNQRSSSFLPSSSPLSGEGEEKKNSRDTRVKKREKKGGKGERANNSTDISGVCTPERVRGESRLWNEENPRAQRGEEEREYEDEEEERMKAESFLSYAGCLDSPEVIEALRQGSAFSLILTPTRELALQISHEIHSLLRTHFFIPPRTQPTAFSLSSQKLKTHQEEEEEKREREREREEGDGEGEREREEDEGSTEGEERERGVSSLFPSLSRRETVIETMYRDVYRKIGGLERRMKELRREQKELQKSSYLEEKIKQRKLAALAVRLSETKRSIERANEERCLIEIHLSQSLGEGKRPRLLLLLDEPLEFMSPPSQGEEEREDSSDQAHLQGVGEKRGERRKKKKKERKKTKAESAFMSGLRNPRELPQWMRDK